MSIAGFRENPSARQGTENTVKVSCVSPGRVCQFIDEFRPILEQIGNAQFGGHVYQLGQAVTTNQFAELGYLRREVSSLGFILADIVIPLSWNVMDSTKRPNLE